MKRDEQWLLQEKYSGETTEGFFADCERLKAGEPLAYLIGSIPFLDCTIHLDSKPLIPRPETEYWTERAIVAGREASATKSRPLRVLDLCAGSGAIGVAVAKAILETHVSFAELDPTHLSTIEKNLRTNDIATTRTATYSGDLFAALPKHTERFDFILSNPPYIDPTLDRTEASVKDFEPHIALYGGNAGLELIARMITDAANYLAPTGQLWLEHEPEQAEAIAQLAEEHHFIATSHEDQYHTVRYSILIPHVSQ